MDQLSDVHHRGRLEVLNMLGDQGWDLVELETLPFGIALPIHEALQSLREHPPTGARRSMHIRATSLQKRRDIDMRELFHADLTPDKYILIGREDMAATMLCLAEAQDSASTLPDGDISEGGGRQYMARSLSPEQSSFVTPRLSEIPQYLTPGSSQRNSRIRLRGSTPSVSGWACSANGTPVQPNQAQRLQQEWASRYLELSV
jgi:hypothetical protein